MAQTTLKSRKPNTVIFEGNQVGIDEESRRLFSDGRTADQNEQQHPYVLSSNRTLLGAMLWLDEETVDRR